MRKTPFCSQLAMSTLKSMNSKCVFTDFEFNNYIIEVLVRHCSHKTTANERKSILCEKLMSKKL